MYSASYEPETDFVPTEPITADMAREKVSGHVELVKSQGFDINTETGRYHWECMNYYNQIILKSKIKKPYNHDN